MKYPPLKVWLVSVILLFGILSFLYTYKKEISRFFFKSKIDYAFQKNSINEGDIKVVLLCSSYARRALSNPMRLSEVMNERHQACFSFIKLFKHMGEFEDFAENEYLIEKINEIDPDYVVIQENHVFFKKNERKGLRLDDFGLKDIDLISHVEGLIIGFDSLYAPKPKEDTIVRIDYMDSTAEKIFSRRSKILNKKHWEWKKFSNRTKGYKIILNVPLPAPLEAQYDKIRDTKDYQRLIKQKRSKAKFKYLVGPHEFPYRYYDDVNHMNKIGEEVFTDWFIDRLYEFHDKRTESKK